MTESLRQSISHIPPGRWAIGVSGGADSTSLLRLMLSRMDVELIVTHLNHETRGEESDGDERFVHALCRDLNVECASARISEFSEQLRDAPANVSARYRFARFALFHQTIEEHNCLGVLLAHHHGDVIETVFQRLLRGSGVAGLGGIRSDAHVHGVRVVRPLLDVRSQELREYLRSIGQNWREDASNESLKYSRNRIRQLLRDFPALNGDINAVRSACDALHQWIEANAPTLARRFAARQLADLPMLLANESARRWLIEVGCLPDHLEPVHLSALVAMSRDASTPPRYTFPGRVMIARKSGWIERIA